MTYADTDSTLTIPRASSSCCHSHPLVSQVSGPLPEWRKFLDRIDHLLPCKAAWMAIKDGKIIAWHDGPHWFITRYLKQMNIKTDFYGLVQRRGCSPAGGPGCKVHH